MSEEQTIRISKEMFEKLGAQMKGVIEAYVAVASDRGVVQEDVGVGVLSALLLRLRRVDQQLKVILNPESGRICGVAITCKHTDESVTPSSLLASIRATLDSIEERIAQRVPHRSSGTTGKFHGTKRMTRADGKAIRADFHGMTSEVLYRKWCCDEAHRGVVDGEGEYTRVQVGAAIGHSIGGHLRRQRSASQTDPEKKE